MDAAGFTLPRPRGRAHLAAARELIEQGAVSVLSLDVFDTLLWRTVPRPTDAFVILGEDLRSAEVFAGDLDAYAFRRLRIAAEQRARWLKEGRRQGVEVTLEEIWAQLPPHLFEKGGREQGPRREVAVEARVTRPDLDIVELAEAARDRGVRLALVSNTYFTRQDLAHLFARPELEFLQDSTVFPSCAYGVSKADGLWQMVVDELGVAPTRVLHVGDEEVSDVKAPGELGIRTVHFRRMLPAVEQLLARESAFIPEPLSPAAHTVNRWVGDFGFTGVRTKVTARLDGTDLPPTLYTSWMYGAGVLGPLLTGFAEWMHREAAELGVPAVWCMMREGELLADLFNRTAVHKGSGIEGRPVWLSRHLTARASLATAGSDELRKLLVRRMPPTVRQFVANLGLTPSEVPSLAGGLDRRMDRGNVVDEVIGTISGSDHLRSRVLDESAAARHRLLSYLDHLWGDQEGPICLVDLGWGGTIQAQLADLLRLAGRAWPLVGLYMITNDSALPRMLDGCDIRGYLASCGTPEFPVGQISRSPEIIEMACLATTGSAVDFDGDGRPVLDPFVPPPDQVVSKLVVQHGIKAFQQEWLRYETALPDVAPLDGGERPLLLEILRTSVVRPTFDEARTFGEWAHEDNFGGSDRDHVISGRLGRYVPYLSPLDLGEMATQDTYWPFGLAVLYDRGLAGAMDGVVSGAVGADAFSPDGDHRVTSRLWTDCGHGFSDPQERPLRVNRNGLSYLRFSVAQPGITALRFDPAAGPAVFRIEWIDLSLRIEGQPAPQEIHLEGQDDLAGLVYSQCRWLYAGVAISTTGAPSVHIPLSGRATGPVYAVTAEFALAVMPLPAAAAAAGGTVPAAGNRLTWAVARARSEAAGGGMAAVGRGVLRVARRTLGR